MKKKLWMRIFIRITIIFVAFVAVLAVSNGMFLVRFFTQREKQYLKNQGAIIRSLDFSDESGVLSAISDISDNYNFEIEIYNNNGIVLYTTYGSQMMDFYHKGNPSFQMNHKNLDTTDSKTYSDGSVLETASDNYTHTEYLVYRFAVNSSVNAELRVQTTLLKNSADIANEFITIIACICLAAALIWVFFFARKFSRPIAEMSDITRQMARLDFSRRVNVSSGDEIGRLAESINDMSEKLNATLCDLKQSNSQLRDEIEMEHQLDAMRRGFVANVSHELKTPIAIIQGYAEGLKLNVNDSAKDDYCNTIIDESQRMNKLVLSLLQLSRYESGQLPQNREQFDVAAMADDMCTRIFKDSGITVIKDYNSTFVNADPAQTEQIFTSILENARSHVNKNGTVRISIAEDADGIKVSIFNTGSHIDEDKMPQIWQSFFRGDSSHKRDQSRFGLGLSIVSAICRQNGKSCGVYNTENGVCFWYILDK